MLSVHVCVCPEMFFMMSEHHKAFDKPFPFRVVLALSTFTGFVWQMKLLRVNGFANLTPFMCVYVCVQ